jgi:hypothetical protein
MAGELVLAILKMALLPAVDSSPEIAASFSEQMGGKYEKEENPSMGS